MNQVFKKIKCKMSNHKCIGKGSYSKVYEFEENGVLKAEKIFKDYKYAVKESVYAKILHDFPNIMKYEVRYEENGTPKLISKKMNTILNYNLEYYLNEDATKLFINTIFKSILNINRLGIRHGDINYSNIFYDEIDVYLGDFSLMISGHSLMECQHSISFYSFYVRPPELREITHRSTLKITSGYRNNIESDIWSYGALLKFISLEKKYQEPIINNTKTKEWVDNINIYGEIKQNDKKYDILNKFSENIAKDIDERMEILNRNIKVNEEIANMVEEYFPGFNKWYFLTKITNKWEKREICLSSHYKPDFTITGFNKEKFSNNIYYTEFLTKIILMDKLITFMIAYPDLKLTIGFLFYTWSIIIYLESKNIDVIQNFNEILIFADILYNKEDREYNKKIDTKIIDAINSDAYWGFTVDYMYVYFLLYFNDPAYPLYSFNYNNKKCKYCPFQNNVNELTKKIFTGIILLCMPIIDSVCPLYFSFFLETLNIYMFEKDIKRETYNKHKEKINEDIKNSGFNFLDTYEDIICRFLPGLYKTKISERIFCFINISLKK